MRRILATLLMIGLTACQTADSRLYTLAVLPPAVAAVAGTPSTLGLGTLEVPPLIDRPQIVRRIDANRIEALEFDRWAEPLVDGLRATLAGDLAARLPGVTVLPVAGALPGPGAATLSVTILRFDADTAGRVVLDAQWSLSTAGRSGVNRRDIVDVQVASGEPAALVAAMSRAVAGFADRVAVAARAPVAGR